MTVTPYKFELSSTDSSLDFSSLDQKQYARVVIEDEIDYLFPYMEVHLNDVAGILVEGMISGEGLSFTSALGSNEEGYDGWIYGNWMLRNVNTNDIRVDGHFGGMIGIGFQHDYKGNDVPKTRAWNDTISNIVKNVLEVDYQLTDPEKIFITRTEGKKIRYQNGINNKEFIDSLLKRAYSSTYEYSPFVSFINIMEEFYFCTIEDLFNIGTRVDEKPFIFKADVGSSYDKYTFKKVDNIFIQGLTTNKQNYKKNIHKFKYTATAEPFELETTEIENHLLNNDTEGRLLINSNLPNITGKYFSKESYGLYNLDNDFEDYKGYRNSFYKENLFNFQLTGIVPFHPKVASGRIMNLEVESVLPDKGGYSREYSGEWLITKNKVFYDFDGMPFNAITIGKNYVIPDATYALLNQVI